jgi:ABC-type lipoprotein release transport system permease subunit
VVLGLGVLLAVVASVIPAWYVARIKPADVLRAE